MPNGGPDNCANCRFYRDQRCSLRDVPISNDHWTYCRDFTSLHSHEPLQSKTASGPIFASGGYEGGVGYVRIPWFGAVEPTFNIPVECWVCGRRVHGIELRVDGKVFGFCTNRHYVDWWKLNLQDPTVDSAYLNTPEEFLREPPDEK